MSKGSNVSSSPFKRALWKTAGFISLGIAYVGFVTPGIPFSIFLVFSAYAFSRSSQKWHDWLYNHKHFGPFLTNWVEKRIFPQRLKYAMILVMSSSLAFLWFTTYNVKALMWSGAFMAGVAIWSWRYPGSEEEWNKRNDSE
jgi:uncharacterized membrane protein YbaN (DUF454 family)